MRSRNLKLLFLIIFGSCALLAFTFLRVNMIPNATSFKQNIAQANAKFYNSVDSCKKTIEKLPKFAVENNYNENLFFIIDLDQHSGQKRFFVFDKKQDSIVASGMVAQGQGKMLSAKPTFSNESGSYCSSKGIYVIGDRYNGRFGTAFKLHGKEASNSNAFARFVVLHAHECIPDAEVYPNHICQSQGCPTVSPSFLNTLDGYIQSSKKKIVLVIR